MRNFLQSSAGVSFYGGSNTTFIPRKDCVEIVIKIKSALYGVVTVTFDAHDVLVLTTLWGNFFQRLHNSSRPDMLLEKMRLPYPEFYKLATEGADYDLVRFPTTDCDCIDGIVKTCKIHPGEDSFMHVFTAPDIITEAFKTPQQLPQNLPRAPQRLSHSRVEDCAEEIIDRMKEYQ